MMPSRSTRSRRASSAGGPQRHAARNGRHQSTYHPCTTGLSSDQRRRDECHRPDRGPGVAGPAAHGDPDRDPDHDREAEGPEHRDGVGVRRPRPRPGGRGTRPRRRSGWTSTAASARRRASRARAPSRPRRRSAHRSRPARPRRRRPTEASRRRRGPRATSAGSDTRATPMHTTPPGSFTAAAAPPRAAPRSHQRSNDDGQRRGHQPRHHQVVVGTADAVRDRQRAGEDQRRGTRRVLATARRQPRHGPGEQRQAEQREDAVADHEQPGVVGDARDERAPRQRQRAVRRQRVHPERVDRLPDLAVEDAGRPDVRRETDVGELRLGGVAPGVPAEHRGREQQRQAPREGGDPHQPEPLGRVGAGVRPGRREQPQPRRAEQGEAGHDDHQARHPPGLGLAERLEQRCGGHRARPGQHRGHQTADQHQGRAEGAAKDHAVTLGAAMSAQPTSP